MPAEKKEPALKLTDRDIAARLKVECSPGTRAALRELRATRKEAKRLRDALRWIQGTLDSGMSSAHKLDAIQRNVDRAAPKSGAKSDAR